MFNIMMIQTTGTIEELVKILIHLLLIVYFYNLSFFQYIFIPALILFLKFDFVIVCFLLYLR